MWIEGEHVWGWEWDGMGWDGVGEVAIDSALKIIRYKHAVFWGGGVRFISVTGSVDVRLAIGVLRLLFVTFWCSYHG